MTKNHIDFRLLNNCKKFTLERIIMAINRISKTPLINKVVDQKWNCKKIDTIKMMRINNLFLGSNLWVNVP